MKNIIWQKPDGEFAITSLADPAADSAAHAAQLKANGTIPADWIVSAVNSTLPAKPLAQLRTEKLASLEASRKQAIDTLPPVTVAGKLYPATPDFSRELTSIARRLANGKPVPSTLRDVDGASAPLNAVLIGQIDDAIAAAVIAVRDRYWLRVDTVKVAATAAEVALVVW